MQEHTHTQCVLTITLSPKQEGAVMSDHLKLLVSHTGHCRDGGRWYDPLRIDILKNRYILLQSFKTKPLAVKKTPITPYAHNINIIF